MINPLTSTRNSTTQRGAILLRLLDPKWEPALQYRSPRNDYRDLLKILECADLRRVRLHDLRHTAASLMLTQECRRGWSWRR
jgi:integrase